MNETQSFELKSSWSDDYLAEICGFANAHGGTLIIGKNDNGDCIGIAEPEKLLTLIPSKIRDTLGIVVDVNLCYDKNLPFIEINIPPFPDPVDYKGVYYYRSGTTKQRLQGAALIRFFQNKKNWNWEQTFRPEVKPVDLDPLSFDTYRALAVECGRIQHNDLVDTPLELLERLNLAKNGVCNHAGVLLFTKNPEQWIPGAFIKIGYFANDWDMKFHDDVSGSLINQAEQAIDLIYTKYLFASIAYGYKTRVERYPFPKESIREALFNALVHKDYASMVPIQVRVYSDKLIINNQALLPNDVSYEHFINANTSNPLNPLIANAFYRSGYIESWGRGIAKIMSECQTYGCAEPKYDVSNNHVRIVFSTKATPTNHPFDNDDLLILESIAKHPSISQRSISETTGLNRSHVQRKMNNLVDNGILGKRGSTRKMRFILYLDATEMNAIKTKLRHTEPN